MLTVGLSTAMRRFWRFLVDRAREVQTQRARYWELRASDAEARGLKLLREWLSPEQRAQFDAENSFDVIGCHSGKKYRIRYGSAANVDELDDAGVARMCWCFVPNAYLVAGDVMLAQKIALETNERGALAVANMFPRALPNAPVVTAVRSRGF
jgi:hypothetical protein